MRTNTLTSAAALAAASLIAVAAILLAVVAVEPASAQNRRLQQLLDNAERVECSFSTLVTGDWEDSTTSMSVAPVEQSAAFFDIDVDEGTAESEGRFGASFIVVRRAHTYLHFMQMLSSGPLYLTTVLAEETSDGKLKAMHTRHEFSPTKVPGFTSRPEMYLGECTVQARAD
jgi:hypothetical protein